MRPKVWMGMLSMHMVQADYSGGSARLRIAGLWIALVMDWDALSWIGTIVWRSRCYAVWRQGSAAAVAQSGSVVLFA